jgi:hypothetical protein
MSKAYKKAKREKATLNKRLAKLERGIKYTTGAMAPASAATMQGMLDTRRAVNRVRGTEMLGEVNVDLTTNDGMHAFQLDHEGFTGTRLADQFDLYEYWFVHSLKFKFIPMRSTGTSGSVYMAPEWDPMDPPPAGEDVKKTMASSLGFKGDRVYNTFGLRMENFRLPDGNFVKPCLFCAPLAETRMSSFGQLFVYVFGCNSSTELVGTLEMEYDISFCLPQKTVAEVPFTTPATTAANIANVDANSQAQSIADAIKATSGSGITKGIQFTDSGGSPVAIGVNKLITFVLDEESDDLKLTDIAGRAIRKGTRLYARPATDWWNETTQTFDEKSSSSLIEEISTSPIFKKSCSLLRSGVAAAALGIIQFQTRDMGTYKKV